MNLYAFGIGILVAIYVVLRLRSTELERTTWAYPLLLATFPLYYLAFALFVSDYAVLPKEIFIGLAFLAIAYIVYSCKSFITLLLLALGYVLHAAYDFYHNLFFVNAGVPHWWPEFCGSVDALIGSYIVYLAFLFRNSSSHSSK